MRICDSTVVPSSGASRAAGGLCLTPRLPRGLHKSEVGISGFTKYRRGQWEGVDETDSREMRDDELGRESV